MSAKKVISCCTGLVLCNASFYTSCTWVGPCSSATLREAGVYIAFITTTSEKEIRQDLRNAISESEKSTLTSHEWGSCRDHLVATAWLLFNPPAGSLVGLTVVAVVAVVAVVVATSWLIFNPRREPKPSSTFTWSKIKQSALRWKMHNNSTSCHRFAVCWYEDELSLNGSSFQKVYNNKQTKTMFESRHLVSTNS